MNNNNISLIYKKLLTTTTTMVLRDVRDMGKQQKGPGQERWDNLARECGFMYKNKRIRKILRKKKRVKIKKI